MKNTIHISKLIWHSFLAVMLVLCVYSIIVQGKKSKLKGAYTQAERPSFSIASWLDGSYQSQFEKSASANFAFKPMLVRMHNQWDLAMWNRANANGVVFGKDDYLFEQTYIEGYYGKKLQEKQRRFNSKKTAISYTHEQIKQNGNKLVFLLMPSKTFLHPDKIPEDQQQDVPESHIHDYFLDFAQEKQLNVIDFQNYFLREQFDNDYPIFPRHGIHLSQYAESLVLDSLLKYIEHHQGKDIYDYRFDEIVESAEPRGRDNDIAEVLNLQIPLKNKETLAYRRLQIDSINKKLEPQVLVIGDSFYWGLYPLLKGHGIFKRHEFWYRNRQIFSPTIKQQKFSNDLTCLESVAEFDYVFIMITANAMDGVGWGYFNSVYKYREDQSFSPKDAKRINQIITNLKNNPANYELVKQKAKDRNISLDSMLYLDAKWLYERENK